MKKLILVALAVLVCQGTALAQPTESPVLVEEIELSESGIPRKDFLWGAWNYEYAMRRQQYIMGFEVATNALPIGLDIYAWVDLDGAMREMDNQATSSNLDNHIGAMDIDWWLGYAVDDPCASAIGVEAEYNVSSYVKDNLFFGPKVAILDIPILDGIRNTIDSIGYPGGSCLNVVWYVLRTDHTDGFWSRLAIFYNLPITLAGVSGYSKAWCDIDFNDPNGQGDKLNGLTVSLQNTIGVNIWSNLYLCWELKYEDFNYWTKIYVGKDLRLDSSLMVSWEVLF